MTIAFNYTDVNHAFNGLCNYINLDTQKSELSRTTVERSSRNGPVIYFPDLVTVKYLNPLQRVLLNKVRDCNHFFHLFESLWMLAGRNDLETLSVFTSKMAQFSDDGKTIHGAYGRRWRKWGGHPGHSSRDQFTTIIAGLRENPDNRRAVLQMFDPEVDSQGILYASSYKDVPCNVSADFQINNEGKLDMYVFNRSNDLILGMLGANAVHFSFLQEYLADAIGVPVGTYTQITCNLHVYSKDLGCRYWDGDLFNPYNTMFGIGEFEKERIPLLSGITQKDFDHELNVLMSGISLFVQDKELGIDEIIELQQKCKSKFLKRVALPMILCFLYWKENRNYASARYWLDQVEMKDWFNAGLQWMSKRESGDTTSIRYFK